MPEPLKNLFSRPLLADVSREIKTAHPAFDHAAFQSHVFDENWESLELKQRMRHISHSLRRCLPPSYPEAVRVLVKVAENIIDREGDKMWFTWCFLPDFVEVFGLNEPEISLPAIETLTRISSAEFAIRPFLLRYPERTFAQMRAWSGHESAMVRRLSSEGFRPRLPWGMGVPALKKDPSPMLPVLEALKDDPAETVRRSVANHLNDISKDHPELVLGIAERWLGHSPERDWIIRHACRGLLKKGNAAALAHFGFEKGVEGIEVSGLHCDAEVAIGGRLDFGFAVKNTAAMSATLRLEYAIDYINASGKISRKVFKIKEMELPGGVSEQLAKYQRFTDFTTRKHFVGRHRLEVLVNGEVLAGRDFWVADSSS